MKGADEVGIKPTVGAGRYRRQVKSEGKQVSRPANEDRQTICAVAYVNEGLVLINKYYHANTLNKLC